MQADRSLQNQYFYDPAFRTPQQPYQAGMVPGAAVFRGGRKRYLKVEEAGGQWDRGRRRTNCEVFHALHRLPDVAVRECVQRNVPTNRTNFLNRLSRFTAALKHLYPGEPPGVWAEAVRVWYFLARPLCRRMKWAEAWGRFQQAYSATRPKPAHTLAEAVRKAGVGGDTARALSAVSRHLKRRTFFVSCRTLAGWIGVSPATAARRLNELVRSGAVRRTTGSGPHIYDRKADTYDVSPLFALCDRATDPKTTFTINEVKLLSPVVALGGSHRSEPGAEGETLLCLIPIGEPDPVEDALFADLMNDDETAGERPPDW